MQPCGGCGRRQDVIKGLVRKQAEQRSLEQAQRRLAVVSQHLARDARQVVRSVLPSRRGR